MASTLPSRRAALASALSALFVLALAVACGSSGGESTTEPTSGRASLRVVAGADQSDTALARLTQALVVEVRDSTGRFTPGLTVRFETIYATVRPGEVPPSVFVSPLAGQFFGTLSIDVTDAQGRAKTLVELNSAAGTAWLVVSVPELGIADTVSYVVKPGAPAKLAIAPRDTMIQPGDSYTLAVAITDRHGNPIAGLTPTYATGTGVTISPSGRVTAGSTPGRATITASFREIVDGVSVSIFPRLTLVAKNYGAVALLNTDHSGYVELASTSHYSLSPHGVKATSNVVFYQGDPGYDAKVWVVAPGGAPKRLTASVDVAEAWPRFSPAGDWVYFVRTGPTLWRARLDGSSLDSLTTVTPPRTYAAPSVSPDGGTVAIEDATGVKLFDVVTRTSRTLPVTCGAPRYSPDGASFACLSSRVISVMRIDGSGARVVAALTGRGHPLEDLSGVDWSPDGKWLVTYVADEGLVLFEVSTGARIPVTNQDEGVSQASFVR